MKKLLSLFLAAMLLLLPALCMAQEAYTSYTDPAARFSFGYPADWKVLSKDTIDEIMGLAAEQGDEQLSGLVQSIKPQLEAIDMVMFMSPALNTNINVVCQPVGIALDSDMLLAMAPQFTSQLQTAMPGFELAEEPSAIELPAGNAMILGYQYTLSGVDMVGVQAYVPVGTDLYIFTLTTIPENVEIDSEHLGYMLGTLQAN